MASPYTLNHTETEAKIRIIHFNDVYNVEPRTVEPCGGAARFKTAVLSLSNQNTIRLFSGDCLAPSISL
jgi:PREDICTED: similar to AGAP007730-PA